MKEVVDLLDNKLSLLNCGEFEVGCRVAIQSRKLLKKLKKSYKKRTRNEVFSLFFSIYNMQNTTFSILIKTFYLSFQLPT